MSERGSFRLESGMATSKIIPKSKSSNSSQTSATSRKFGSLKPGPQISIEIDDGSVDIPIQSRLSLSNYDFNLRAEAAPNDAALKNANQSGK